MNRMKIFVVWLLAVIQFSLTLRFDMNIHTCSYVKQDLICKINSDGIYRGDRDLSGILTLTLLVDENVQASVWVEKLFFKDVKNIRIMGNCRGVKVVSHIEAKCMKVSIINVISIYPDQF